MSGQSYQLIMRSGPTPGQAYPLQKQVVSIGRDPSSDIVINDAEVSRQHSRLSLQAGGYVLEDLGSTNGTFVNGQRLMGPRVLRPGEVVSVGEHITLSYELFGVDADATVASSARQSAPPPAPEKPAPKPPAPVRPVPSYSGQVPQSRAAAESPLKSENSRVWIIVVVVVLLFALCLCGGVMWYIDANDIWCDVSGFIWNFFVPGSCP